MDSLIESYEAVAVSLATAPTTPVTDNGGSLTVDGTVTSRLADGAGNNLTSAARGSERALSVQIVDASGAQVTTFGGGGGGGGSSGVGTTGEAIVTSTFCRFGMPIKIPLFVKLLNVLNCSVAIPSIAADNEL
jgi:hypothetical protein